MSGEPSLIPDSRSPSTEGTVRVLVLSLVVAYVGAQLLLKSSINFAHEMHHEDVFRGNGAVSFQFIAPVPIWMLMRKQSVQCSVNRFFQYESLFFQRHIDRRFLFI